MSIVLKPYKKEHLHALSSGDLAVLLNAFVHAAILGSTHLYPDIDLATQIERTATWMRESLYNMTHVDEVIARVARGEHQPAATDMLEVSVGAFVGIVFTYGDKKAAADAIAWSADNLPGLFTARDT
jgi:hypothetical protein